MIWFRNELHLPVAWVPERPAEEAMGSVDPASGMELTHPGESSLGDKLVSIALLAHGGREASQE